MGSSRIWVLGALLGAAVVWLWGREMKEYLAEKTRAVRTKTAEGVRGIQEEAEKVLDRGGDALHPGRRLLAGHEGACQRAAPGK